MFGGKRRRNRKTFGLAIGLIALQIDDAEKYITGQGGDIHDIGRRMFDKFAVSYIHGALAASGEACGLSPEDEEGAELWNNAIGKIYSPEIYGPKSVERVLLTIAENAILEDPHYLAACEQGSREAEDLIFQYRQGTSLATFLKTGEK